MLPNSFIHLFMCLFAKNYSMIDGGNLNKTQILLLGRSQSSNVNLGKFLNLSEAEILE